MAKQTCYFSVLTTLLFSYTLLVVSEVQPTQGLLQDDLVGEINAMKQHMASYERQILAQTQQMTSQKQLQMSQQQQITTLHDAMMAQQQQLTEQTKQIIMAQTQHITTFQQQMTKEVTAQQEHIVAQQQRMVALQQQMMAQQQQLTEQKQQLTEQKQQLIGQVTSQQHEIDALHHQMTAQKQEQEQHVNAQQQQIVAQQQQIIALQHEMTTQKQQLTEQKEQMTSELAALRIATRRPPVDKQMSRRLLEDDIVTEVRTLKQQMVAVQATQQKQGLFVATNAHLTTDVAPGPNQHIIFDDVAMNHGNAYSTVHGAFTAPYAGTYVFSVSTCSHGGHFIDLELMKNAVSVKGFLAGDTSYDDCSSGTTILDLQAGDDVFVRHIGSWGDLISAALPRAVNFMGFLLHAS